MKCSVEPWTIGLRRAPSPPPRGLFRAGGDGAPQAPTSRGDAEVEAGLGWATVDHGEAARTGAIPFFAERGRTPRRRRPPHPSVTNRRAAMSCWMIGVLVLDCIPACFWIHFFLYLWKLPLQQGVTITTQTSSTPQAKKTRRT